MNTYYNTVEEYRQRMIEAFHNADCDYLIPIACLPNEKEFTHLECLLKYGGINTSTRTSKELFIKRLEEIKEDIDRHIAQRRGENK